MTDQAITITLINIIWLIVSFLLIKDNIRLRRYLRERFVTNKEHAELHQLYIDAGTQAATMSEQFINAPKLIALHRNGRLNVWTFARGDEMITIETMGLLSDDVENWKQQLGLNDNDG